MQTWQWIVLAAAGLLYLSGLPWREWITPSILITGPVDEGAVDSTALFRLLSRKPHWLCPKLVETLVSPNEPPDS